MAGARGNALPNEVKGVVSAPIHLRAHSHYTQQVPALCHALLHRDIGRKAWSEGHGHHEHNDVTGDVVGRPRYFVLDGPVVDVELHSGVGCEGWEGVVKDGEGGGQSVLHFAVVPQHHALLAAVADEGQ